LVRETENLRGLSVSPPGRLRPADMLEVRTSV
jgi:hypothetical protein